MRRTLPLLLLMACAPDDGDTWQDWFVGDGTVLDDAHANVISSFSFLPEGEGGLQGFDLDDEDTTEADSACGFGDGIAPDGTPGIDNQLGVMWGLIEGLVGEQVETLLQGSINEGRFLVMVELVGLDDLENDDDVTVTLFRGAGEPWVGGLDRIAPDQTYRVDPSIPVSTVEGVALVDGVLEAGPVDFTLPIDILEANFPMHVTDGRLRVEIDADGRFRGMMGGLVDVEAMLQELLATDAAAEAELVAPFFRSNIDAPDERGDCVFLSTAFGYEGTTAFVLHEPTDGE